MKRRFVLLDRDGTIILHRHHLKDLEQVELIPNVAKAITQLKNLGLGIIILTNQSIVGRGYITVSDLQLIHTKILNLLSAEGAVVDAIYFCPHKPEDNCLCRKPKPGMVEEAMRKHNFDPKLCFVVGDNKGDIELGKNIGATTILVKTGYGREVSKDNSLTPDYIVDSLEEAKNVIAQQLKY